MKKLFFVALLSSLAIGSARAENPDLMTLIGASSAGDDYGFIDNKGYNNNGSTYNLSTSDYNSFAVDYGNSGVVRGHGRCSTRAGDSGTWDNDTYNVISGNFVDSLTDETGQTGALYCYCGLDSYTPQNGSAQSLSGSWVFYGDSQASGDDGCAGICSSSCAIALNGGKTLAFRAAVFNAYAPSSSASGDAITTRTYVDNLLNTKQAKITTTGTNKLMTFGSSAGNIGSRDIVSTLGTSTTATTVPEVGPIVTGLNGKQNTVNGTANFVMTGTGTAGTLGEKPVYSSSVQKSNALVTAQTINTAAMDAANSEMMCHTYVANASQTPENCLLWAINSTSPTGLEIFNLANIIGTTQMTALTSTKSSGETNRGDPSAYGIAGQSSAYAIDFGDKGVVKGYGRCSTQSGTNNSETWSNPTTFVDLTDETGQSGARYCYCTLTSYTPVGGSPRSLSGPGWVYFDSWSGGTGASNCASSCANNCGAWSGNYVSNSNKKYRAMMYNAYD